MMRGIALFMAALAALAAPALAETVRHGDMEIEGLRVRMVEGYSPATSAYAKITNTGSANDRLVSVWADIAHTSEIHTIEVREDIMRMRPVMGGVALPGGRTVHLRPGGLHLMLMRLKSRPAEGDTVTIRLEFEQAGTVEIKAPVVRMDGRHGH